jgi:hypothetical protein
MGVVSSVFLFFSIQKLCVFLRSFLQNFMKNQRNLRYLREKKGCVLDLKQSTLLPSEIKTQMFKSLLSCFSSTGCSHQESFLD